jgi:hypothetical protein
VRFGKCAATANSAHPKNLAKPMAPTARDACDTKPGYRRHARANGDNQICRHMRHGPARGTSFRVELKFPARGGPGGSAFGATNEGGGATFRAPPGLWMGGYGRPCRLCRGREATARRVRPGLGRHLGGGASIAVRINIRYKMLSKMLPRKWGDEGHGLGSTKVPFARALAGERLADSDNLLIRPIALEERFDYDRLVEDMAAVMCERPPVATEVRERERYLHQQADPTERAYRAAMETQRQSIVEAANGSRQLLIKELSPAQLEDFDHTGSFNVRGGDTGTLYRIVYGTSMNIVILSVDGAPTGQRICFAPRGYIPTFDCMLAQKISLESDETATLRIANRTFLRVTNPRDQHGSPGQPWIAWASVDTLSQ